MNRTGLVATVALIAALFALALSVWSAVMVARTRDEIRSLGDILAGGPSPFRMTLDRPPPPQFDPDDR